MMSSVAAWPWTAAMPLLFLGFRVGGDKYCLLVSVSHDTRHVVDLHLPPYLSSQLTTSWSFLSFVP
jgi:hypothetical protein